MKHTKAVVFAVLPLLLCFVSCGAPRGDAAGEGFDSSSAQFDGSARLMAAPEAAAGAVSGEMTLNSEEERKLVFTGNISLEVQSLSDARAQITAWVEKYGGYISQSNETRTSSYFTAHVPAESFGAAMDECGAFGRLKSKDINSEDVTERYYDLDTRLSARRVLQARLQSYLSEATNMEDLLKIETELNDVTSELESMQRQMNRLQNEISYSTIYVSCSLPENESEEGFIMPDARSQARRFLSNVIEFFVNLVFIVFYVVIFGIPIVLLLALLYWLCFGKVGLLVRLFNRIKRK